MRCASVVVLSLLIGALVGRAGDGVVAPYEQADAFEPANPIDEHVMRALRARGIWPAHLSSDAVFCRRVFLDVIGTLPEPREVRAFLDDDRPDKRARLIETLMERDEFADYWALKWCDLLRVKAEFPINLWPNAVQAYHRWVRDAVAENMSYDQFVRALLTSSGSNFRVPPVNFYRAMQGHEPSTIAAAVGLTFMGTRVEHWSPEELENFEVFFSRVAFKGTAEWKEEIVHLDPFATGSIETVFPDGSAARVRSGDDPREVFTDWLIRPENPWFARNAVNRVWAWLMGRGIIHEPDDIRPDNPPSNPELLRYLEGEFVGSGYDLRHVYRLILNSRTYQQSSILRSVHPDAEKLFACYPVRRLDAEVLIDALCSFGGPSEEYTSAIPEPFTYIPENTRTIKLADGSITSSFLEMFGRPSRDTGLWSERNNRMTESQRLHLLNSSHVRKKIERSSRLRTALRRSRRSPERLVESFYMLILSRPPTENEVAVAKAYFKKRGMKGDEAAADLAWALINTKEFLYRH